MFHILYMISFFIHFYIKPLYLFDYFIFIYFESDDNDITHAISQSHLLKVTVLDKVN